MAEAARGTIYVGLTAGGALMAVLCLLRSASETNGPAPSSQTIERENAGGSRPMPHDVKPASRPAMDSSGPDPDDPQVQAFVQTRLVLCDVSRFDVHDGSYNATYDVADVAALPPAVRDAVAWNGRNGTARVERGRLEVWGVPATTSARVIVDGHHVLEVWWTAFEPGPHPLAKWSCDGVRSLAGHVEIYGRIDGFDSERDLLVRGCGSANEPAEDGSFFLLIPADQPCTIEVVDRADPWAWVAGPGVDLDPTAPRLDEIVLQAP